ncbi:iron ABC transporter permease [Fluviicola sp.]|uniref:FecCD family ABC transporter permease n=1 Tax=Fluviicola sp. TaxID=1917219 RepID=UPI0031D3C61F
MSRQGIIGLLLVVLLLVCFVVNLSVGNVHVPVSHVFGSIFEKIGFHTDLKITEIEYNVVYNIRFPRAVYSCLIGAGLAVSGAALQGIFRNPLVDSALIGISTGASLFASLFILFNGLVPWLIFFNEGLSLSIVAFFGATCIAFIVYRLSLSNGEINSLTLILAGIALNALTASLTGLLSFLATDDQLRDLTFWTLGSLGSANNDSLLLLLVFTVIPLVVILRQAKSLNVLSLGESNAQYMGYKVKTIKIVVIVCSTCMVGAAVSMSGVIGFIGLVVPHIIRILSGPDHRLLLPFSAFFGAILLSCADMISRTILPPTEVPIGIITALMGTPVFIAIIFKHKRKFSV